MDLLDRLGFRLLDVARREHASADATELTVADVYQRLIPYRAVRGELGILELAEYEHALLRLLAGEHGFVSVDADDARADIERELRSPNPILGIYRDYAAAPLRLGAPQSAAPASPVPAQPVPIQPVPAPASQPLPRPSSEEPAPTRCRACAEPLPEVEQLRFCPACGTDQREVPCAACGSPLRPEWNFCVRCGTARGGEARPPR